MENFDESELIRSSEFQENHDQATRKFLRREYARLVETTEEQSEKCDSMEAILLKMKNTLPLDNWKMPEFDASIVSDWLSKVERSFRVRRYSDLDKLDLVAFSLEGDALLWFDSEMTRSEFHSWDEFRRRLFLRFAATPVASSETVAELLEERASHTEKKGTVSASVTASAELSSQVIGLDESHLEKLLSTGLQTEMKDVLPLQEPMGLENQTPAVFRMRTFTSTPVAMNEVLKLTEPVRLEKQKKSRCLEALMFNFKPKNKRKLSLSLKTWMFKFKNKILQRNKSITKIHAELTFDAANVSTSRLSEECTHVLLEPRMQVNEALEALKEIPEGLTAVITTCLALGTRQMAQKNALVRQLPSVETLGYTTVICSDKLGTLTTKQLAVSKLVTAICNDASVVQSDQQFVSRGMTTEATLKVLVGKMGFSEGLTNASSNCCRLGSELELRIATLAFDRDRKSMGVMVDSSSGNKLLLVKGAVENVLDRSTRIQLLADSVQELDQYSRDLILQSLHDMSMGALRCLRFQQNSSSIWHRWRRKPLFLLHLWKRNCWYQRRFLLSGLC